MNLVGIQNILDNTSFAILGVTTLSYWVHAAFKKPKWLSDIASAGMSMAALTTTGLLVARWIESGHPFPVSNLYESLFFLCWCVCAVHVGAEWFSRERLIGVFTAPVATLLAAFASLVLPANMQTSAPLVPALQSNWLMLHVSVMILSYGTLLVGSLVSIAYLWVTRKEKDLELRGSSIGTGGYRTVDKTTMETATSEAKTSYAFQANTEGDVLEGNTLTIESEAPVATALQTLNLADLLDNTSYRLIGLGFPLLTIGIIAGAVWANEAWGSYWSWDPKETWSLITWLVFAAYLHSRLTIGWQGRRPALLASLGFVVVWITYLGVNLLGMGLHSYGWFF
jgi:cytochrome c-type biogenesis protein CcsB